MSGGGIASSPVRLAIWAAVIVVFLAIPRLINNPYLIHLAILGMIFAVVASNWDLTLGYAGLFNFSHIALFGLGAYTSGILSVRLGVSPWLGIIAGSIVAVTVAAIISIPAIRLRGIYVALLTFAFAQLASALIVSQTAVTGGQAGLVGVPGLSIGDFQFREHIDAYFYLAGTLLLASTIFLRRVVTSDFGLSLIALRDFEEYAVSRGVPLARQRFLAFLYSAIFTGAAGAVYVHYLMVASPDFFGFSLTTLFLSMILIGGTATIYGAVIAGIVLTYVSELMSPLGPIRFMVVAVLIVVTMWFIPRGIWGVLQRLFSRTSASPFGRNPRPGSRLAAKVEEGMGQS
ncbi:MAG: branched-chain amino acid ABC transporter permease [Thermomicrobiales bacterium]